MGTSPDRYGCRIGRYPGRHVPFTGRPPHRLAFLAQGFRIVAAAEHE
jgi:hypothetical protein